MHIAEYMSANGHEQFAVWTDPAVGLKAFIAIHDTTLGPALGGTRIWPHKTEEDAILDVLRLAKAMTYKSAAAGLPLGGGKGLIIADPRKDKTEALFRSYGRFVNTLGGRYIATEDVGATARDVEWMSYETRHLVGLPRELGGSGNPAVVTGFGLHQAMRACARAVWGSDSLAGKRVAMQGFGNVANSLSEHLLKAGAKLVVTDISEEARRRARAMAGVEVVESPDDIFDVECDVFAPCALGGVLNERTIPRLKCPIVCGGANNQLAEAVDAERLQQRNILYAPDYIVNAGGVINVYYELGRPYNAEAAMATAARIHDTMERVIAMSKQRGITTAHAADLLAEERLSAARRVRVVR
ncbi:MAG: Glu/Leu/Phe/Val dehydrogenase [SAR202 cluster bacterium]|nr:Glu/Leu/Phe/Val dehydrogenase [SAR202 cluster bacterium]